MCPQGRGGSSPFFGTIRPGHHPEQSRREAALVFLAPVLAGIGQPNPASVRLHEAFGFRRVGTLPRIGWKLGKWHDVGYWALNFGEPDEPPEPFDEGGAAPSPD